MCRPNGIASTKRWQARTGPFRDQMVAAQLQRFLYQERSSAFDPIFRDRTVAAQLNDGVFRPKMAVWSLQVGSRMA
jgi:hypothetical protein